MRLLAPPFRTMIAALLLVAVPFCCCEGQVVPRALDGLSGIQSVLKSGDHESAEQHAHDHSPSHGGCTPGSDGQSTPCDDDGPCDCAQHEQAKQLPESPTMPDLSGGALVHVLPSFDPGYWLPDAPVRTFFSVAAIPRPSTSLLRLHCALII